MERFDVRKNFFGKKFGKKTLLFSSSPESILSRSNRRKSFQKLSIMKSRSSTSMQLNATT